MSLIQTMAGAPLAEAAGWALVHSLWQGVLAAAAFYVVLKTVAAPRVRYAAGLLAMAAMVVAFGASLAPLVAEGAKGAPSVALPHSRQLQPVSASLLPAADATREVELISYLSLVWLAGVLCCHVWQLAGLVSMRRLRTRAAWDVSAEWNGALDALRARLGVTRAVRMMESLLVDAPVVLGHWRPVILAPVGMLANLPPGQVEAILLHELAHVRRWDYLVNLIQRWMEALFFYHPAMWWISRVVRAERENCCDDLAVETCGDRLEYASALAALELRRHSVPAAAVAATGGSLQHRVERVLRRDRPSGMWSMAEAAWLTLTAGALVMAGWQLQPAAPQQQAVPPVVEAAQQQFPAPASPPKTGTPLAPPYSTWLRQDVAYIITAVERAAFLKLASNEERERFIEQFWLRRDPTGETVENEAKEEHYRRIAYANERFAGSLPGWRMARGRIYIVWGPPDTIEAHHGAREPFEVWSYAAVSGVRGAVRFRFTDAGNQGEYRLAGMDEGVEAAGFNRTVRWMVTDERNRFVTGLEAEQFELRVNGVQRELTEFSGPGSPVRIAVVAATEIAGFTFTGNETRLFKTGTLREAVEWLAGAGTARRVLIIADRNREGAVPEGIEVVKTEPSTVPNWIVEVQNQYVATFQDTAAAAQLDLLVKPTAGLSLKVSRLASGWEAEPR